MPLLKKKRVLAAAIESTSGTAETLDATDAALNCYDVMFQKQSERETRSRQGSFGQLASIAGLQVGVATFRTDVTGDGAGGIPAWASTFLPACGWVASSQVYSPTTEAPGSNVKTITLGSYQNGTRKLIHGAAGTFQITFMAGKPVFIDWTFTGIWNAPTDTSILSPTYPTDLPPRFASSTFTIGGSAPGCIEQIQIDAGNTVIARPCPGSVAGIASGLITDRNVTGTLNPESRLIATDDVFGDLLAGTEQALSIALDDGTDVITFGAPKLQYSAISEGDREGQQVDDITFQCNPSSGDDEFTITFAASV